MKQQIFYEELISRGKVQYRLHSVIEQYQDWNHEVVGYSRTHDPKLGEESSVLVKFWKEVAE